MFWSESQSNTTQERQQQPNDGIPPTPGAATWAMRALPTLFFGTPKPPKPYANDPVFADLTQDIKASSTSNKKPLTVTEDTRGGDVPSTPNIFKNNSGSGAGGILKTPGTAGPAKNVSFAPGNSDNNTFDESSAMDMDMSPTVRQKGQDTKKLDRVRSGLPHNFPGKFPSPWTPRVANLGFDKDNGNEEVEKNTNINGDKTQEQQVIPEFDLSEMKKMLLKIERNNKVLENKLSKSADESKTYTIEDENLIPNLRQQIEQAVDYAKLRDKETLEYQTKLAELMSNHTQQIEDYEREIETLKKNESNNNDHNNTTSSLLDRAKQENRDKDSKIRSLNEQVQQLNVKLSMNESDNTTNEVKDQEIRRLTDRVEELETKLTQFDQTKDELRSVKSDHAEISRINEDLERENKKISQDLNDARERIRRHLENNDESNHKNNDDIEITTSRLQAELASSKRQYENEKDQLRTELDDSKRKLQQAETTVQERDEKLTKLQATQSDLQGHVTLLREKISKQTKELDKLRADHSNEQNNKHEEIQRLQREKQYLDDQVNSLIEQKATLSNKVESLERDLKTANNNEKKQASSSNNPTPSITTFNGNRDSLLANHQKSYLGLYNSTNNNTHITKNTNNNTSAPLFSSHSQKPRATSDFSHNDKENSQPKKLNFGSLPSEYGKAFSPVKSDTENLISLDSSVDYLNYGAGQSPMKEDNSVKPIPEISMKDASYASNNSSSNSSSILGDPAREQASLKRLAERKKRNQSSSMMSLG